MTLCMQRPLIQAFESVGQTPEKGRQTGNIFFYGLDLKRGHLFHVSSAARQILGYGPQEMMNNGLLWFIQQIETQDLKSLNRLADQPDHDPIIPHICYHFKTKQGGRCRLSEHRCLLRDANGTPSFMIARVERAGDSH